jgi:hypothetical protein
MDVIRDEFLVDKMAGEGAWKGLLWKDRPDFSEWDGFGKLWEWSQKQKWFGSFCTWLTINKMDKVAHTSWIVQFINPDRYADAVHEFLEQCS